MRAGPKQRIIETDDTMGNHLRGVKVSIKSIIKFQTSSLFLFRFLPRVTPLFGPTTVKGHTFYTAQSYPEDWCFQFDRGFDINNNNNKVNQFVGCVGLGTPGIDI